MKTSGKVLLLIFLLALESCGIIFQNQNSYGLRLRRHSYGKSNRRYSLITAQEPEVKKDTDRTSAVPAAIIESKDTLSLPVKSVNADIKALPKVKYATPKADSLKASPNDHFIYPGDEVYESGQELDWAACISFFGFISGILGILVYVFLTITLINISFALSDALISMIGISLLIGLIFLGVSEVLIRYFGMPETTYHIAAQICALVVGMSAFVALAALVYEFLYGF